MRPRETPFRFGCRKIAGAALTALLAPALLASPDPADLTNGRLIGLKATGFFDPAVDRPGLGEPVPEGPEGLRERYEATRYFIVQSRGPITAPFRRELAGTGARIVGHVRNNALVVGLPGNLSETELKNLDGLRYVGPFLPAYKLDPGLSHLLHDDGKRAAPSFSIDVEQFPGESPEALLRTVREWFAAPEVRPIHVGREAPGRPPRLTLDVARAVLDDAIGLLVRSPSVAYVRQRAPLELYNDNGIWIGQSYDRVNGPLEATAPDPKPYSGSATIWANGLTGTGQVIAVADTGLEYDTCFWDDPAHPVVPQQITPPGALTVDPDHRKLLAVNGVNSFVLDHDGMFRHGTHVAASAAGDDLTHLADESWAGHDHGDGMAPDARILFEDIGGDRDGYCLSDLSLNSVADLLEQEYQAGARVSTNSWGAAGGWTDDVDAVVWEHEDLLVIFSSGNDGTNSINAISTNKNGVSVGATENYDATFNDVFGILDPENMTAYSSQGPATDGRIKPDIVAPGHFVFSNRYETIWIPDEMDPQCSPADPTIDVCFPVFGGCYLGFTSDDCAVEALTGTSMATPIVAGLAALTRQYFVDGFWPGGQAEAADVRVPSAALLKAVLLNGARNMTGRLYERRGSPVDYGPLGDSPSNVQGWGRVHLDDALYFTGDARRLELADVANANGLATSESTQLRFSVTSPGEPLKLTLAWTDPPGHSYATVALVNDLDLELEAPGGAVYRGNQWTVDDINVSGDKVSLPDPPGKDSLNNVEGILIPAPAVGLYTATVLAADVPGFDGVSTQGFALAIAGAVTTSPGTVPGGTSAPGTPLTIDKALGDDISLSWAPSCLATGDDYEVYEGNLGDFTSHAPRTCSTGGATSIELTPQAESAYYLVGPRSADQEGSYGTDSTGDERPQSLSACFEQNLGSCP